MPLHQIFTFTLQFCSFFTIYNTLIPIKFALLYNAQIFVATRKDTRQHANIFFWQIKFYKFLSWLYQVDKRKTFEISVFRKRTKPQPLSQTGKIILG